MSFKGDMRMVARLESHMDLLGTQYQHAEKMADMFESHGATGLAESRLAKMISLEKQQDEVNAKLHAILKKYKVFYNRGYFMVENPSGGEQEYFYAKNDR